MENTEMKMRFRVLGMACAACSARVEKIINNLEEVENAHVSLADNTATIHLKSPVKIKSFSAQITDIVEKAGFKATLLQEDTKALFSSERQYKEESDALLRKKKQSLNMELFFAGLVMIIAMTSHFFIPLPSWLAFMDMHQSPRTFVLSQFFLTLPVLWLGRSFYTNGFGNLIRLAPNMDSLVALGTGSAFLYSLWNTSIVLSATDSHTMHMALMGIYFESCAMLIALISLGKYLELKSKNKTQDAIFSLMRLSPKKATLLMDNGEEVEVAVENIQVGDKIFIKSGNQVPVDGFLVQGNASLDMSALTGEFMPVTIGIKEPVISGSLSVGAPFVMEAEHIGSDTVLAKIIALVQEAQGSKAPIARLADFVSLYFVPFVMAIAVLAFLGWYCIGNASFAEALKIFVAVLVVACPCALGLATPMSIMVATGRAAKLGLLIKNGTVLELSSKVDCLVFDKTGTLTQGKPHMELVYSYHSKENNKDEELNLIHLAWALEKNSDHPLKKAFQAFLEQRSEETPKQDFTFDHIKEISGRGLLGYMPLQNQENQGMRVPFLIGNKTFMLEHDIEFSVEEIHTLDHITNDAKSPLLFAQGKPQKLLDSTNCVSYPLPLFEEGKVLAIFSIADTVREESASLIKTLGAEGVDSYLLSGDSKHNVEKVAEQVGILKEHCLAEVMPADKEAQIRALQAKYKCVAMVGDGINDAPALAKADIGMVMGNGMDIAMEAGDVVLLSGISGVENVLRLGRATLKNIKLSLFWAFLYNIMLLPVAAGLLYAFGGASLSPMLAGAAMTLSSVSVVLNALRLRNFKAMKVKKDVNIMFI